MTLATYVNYVLPFVVLALGAGTLLVNTVLRKSRAAEPNQKNTTRAVIDNTLLPRRHV